MYKTGTVPVEQPLMGHCVLLIEDEPVIALDLAMILVGQGGGVAGPAATIDAEELVEV
jgi:hypothetical protein